MRDKELLDAVLEGKLPVSALHGPATAKEEGPSTSREEEEPDWFAAYDGKKVELETLQRLKEEVEQKKRREAKLKKLREEYGSSNWQRKKKVGVGHDILSFDGCLGNRVLPHPLPLLPLVLRVMQKMLI